MERGRDGMSLPAPLHVAARGMRSARTMGIPDDGEREHRPGREFRGGTGQREPCRSCGSTFVR